MVPRPRLEGEVRRALGASPVVAILGPRQCGKTTLARTVAAGRRAEVFDLEDPADRLRLSAPMRALEDLRGLVVIDEIQREPGLFEILRVLADRPGRGARFLVLGNASPGIVRGISESLAGRVRFVDMSGFDLAETGPVRFERLWTRGGLPRAYLAHSEDESLRWREDYIRTFLERDIPGLGVSIPAEALRRFWTMIAHFHGQVWNAAEFARSLGSSEATARRYLDLLSGVLAVRALPPWFENLAKRQVKSPKVYVRDSGLLHALLSLRGRRDLTGHVKYGASWEGFAIEQILSLLGPREAFFWATHSGAELDLFVHHRGRRLGFEFKCADAPAPTRSMRVAIEDLRLDRLWIVYPGKRSFPLDDRIEVLSILDLPKTVGRA